MRSDCLVNRCGFKMGFTQPIRALLRLCADVSTQSDFASAALPAKRRDSLIGDINKIASAGSLTPDQAAKLLGRIGLA